MVIVCHAWLGIGYNFVFFLAALQMIPRSITEAGAMDGARPFRRMLDLQLPLIAPTAFFLLIMNIISSFTDSFGLIDTMTEGGPVGQTEVMVYKIYFDGFKGLDYSGAAAQSIVLMLLVIGAHLHPVQMGGTSRPLHTEARHDRTFPRLRHLHLRHHGHRPGARAAARSGWCSSPAR